MFKGILFLLLAGLLTSGIVGCGAETFETAVVATVATTPHTPTPDTVTISTAAAAAAQGAVTAATATVPSTATAPSTVAPLPTAAANTPPPAVPTATIMLQAASVSPATATIEELTPTMEPTENAAVQQWIAQTTEDLANRLGVNMSDIAFVSFEEKVWPNPGMGCPHPGMQYKQVPVDGYLIRLRVGKQLYNYHGGGGRPPFLCESKINKDDSFVPPPSIDS